MNVVFSHPDALLAQAARDHLLAHGILAAVVERSEAWVGMVRSHEVMVCFAAQRVTARAVLEGEDWRPRRVEDRSWEQAEAIPDLSLLSDTLAPPCEWCGENLPLDGAITHCPSCGGRADVAELIVRLHGPEALRACYEDAPTPLDPAMLARLALLCPSCAYPLSGLPRAGVCPECGRQFDKDGIVRAFLGA